MAFPGVYLDHAGAALPPQDLLDAVFADLSSSSRFIGNPHSSSESSSRLDDARALVLHHFGASGADWDVVFTSGGTASLRLVGELCPFGDGGCLLYPENVHSSALGLRAFAKNAAVFPSSLLNCPSTTIATPDTEPEPETETEIDSSAVAAAHSNMCTDETSVDLLVTSGECNFSGTRSDLQVTAGLVACRNLNIDGGGNGTTKFDLSTANTSAAAVPALSHYPISQLEQSLQWIRGGSSGCGAQFDLGANGAPSNTGHSLQSQSQDRLRKRLLWLLDASKLAATSELNLSDHSRACTPDFVAVSFYKMFGYPTGLGALLIRRSAAALLRPQKTYFGGGTLAGATASEDFCLPRDDAPHAWMEDGTQHYLGVLSLRHGLDMLRKRGGVSAVGKHAAKLCLRLLRGMQALKHDTGKPVVEIYGNHAEYLSELRRSESACESDEAYQHLLAAYRAKQGPTIAFNVMWKDESPVGYAEVGRLAALRCIRLRTGCFCNVGACHSALNLSAADVKRNLLAGRTCWDEAPGADILDGRPTGAVRASLGLDSTEADVDALLSLLDESFVNRVPAVLLPMTMPLSSSHSDASIRLAEINVYPVKSCGGLSVHSWPLCKSGLLLDREWVVADAAGRALTLKTHPRLALVKPVVDLAAGVLLLYASSDQSWETSNSKKQQSRDQMGALPKKPLALPLDAKVADALRTAGAQTMQLSEETSHALSGLVPATPPSCNIDELSVRVCGQRRPATSVSQDANAWFSLLLGFPSYLLRTPEDSSASSATLIQQESSSRTSASSSPAFANEAALLLVSRESIAHLDELLSRPKLASTANFRANLVVEGATSHAEDNWLSVSICRAILKIEKPCARCSVVNVDGRTGMIDGATLRILSSYRRDSGNIYFGQFLSVGLLPEVQSFTTLCVGSDIVPQLNSI